MKRFKIYIFTSLLVFLFSQPIKAEKNVQLEKMEFRVDTRSGYGETALINNNNYIQLRSLAHILKDSFSRFDIAWNQELKQVDLRTGKNPSFDLAYISYSKTKMPASKNTLNFTVDGKNRNLETYIIAGNNYVKIRDMEGLLDFETKWSQEKKLIEIESKSPSGARKLPAGGPTTFNGLSPKVSRYGVRPSTYLTQSDGVYGVLERGAKDSRFLSYDIYNLENNLLIKSQTIPLELETFGGFYSGENYNFIVFGQDNLEELDGKEVLRLVKYDKAFNRLDSLSITGGESLVVRPFQAGGFSADEAGDNLVIHTARERYKTEDGLNHQSQLSLLFNTRTMTLEEEIKAFQANHVSHSFDQRVKFKNNRPVYLDHGDGYPRALVVNMEAHIKGGDRAGYFMTSEDLFPIPGKIGANSTGVSLGGFEKFGDGFLAAINSVDHSKVTKYTDYGLEGLGEERRDIILLYSSWDEFGNAHKFQELIGKYSNTDKFTSTPKLVKIDEKTALVLYEEFNKEGDHLGLIYKKISLDGGDLEILEEGSLLDYHLSNGQPLVVGDKVFWTFNGPGGGKDGNRIKYEIKIK